MRNRTFHCALLSAALVFQCPRAAFADSSGGTYILTKQSIAGGGGTVAAAPYVAVVTLGQAAAGSASGGSFQLIGGFHPAPEPAVAELLFKDGFEN